MLCNAGKSKSIFVDIQNPCLQPPLRWLQTRILDIHENEF